MFDFFKKKSKPNNGAQRRPLNLPVIAESDKTPEKIAEYLRNDVPIWAWYNAMDKITDENGNWCINAMMALEKGRFDGFAMFRKEGELLCKYVLEIYKDGKELHLRLEQIREMKNSNIMEIINGDLAEAYELYHDDENIAATMSFFCHNVTLEEAKASLVNRRVMYVGEERFIKKAK